MSGTTYYQRNREVMLNRAKRHYHDNIDVLREKAKNKYRELSEEEKNIKREYGRNRYHNMSEEKKKRLKEYQRNYREAKRHLLRMHFKIAVTKVFVLLLIFKR